LKKGVEGDLRMSKDMLGAEEVAEYLGVSLITVYRWCREGRLPSLKIGKHWRIRREAFEDFLSRGERPTTLVGQLRTFLRVPENVIGISQDPDLLHHLDAAYFQVGEARGGLLVKFYGGEEEPAEELRASLTRNGLDVERLEKEGRLLMRAEQNPLNGREGELRQIFEEEAGSGRTIWASFDWAKPVDLDTALDQQRALAKLADNRQLVVKTATLEWAVSDWPPAAIRQAQTLHSGTIWLSHAGVALTRVAPLFS
jgi:excisionase family DNA binding protein